MEVNITKKKVKKIKDDYKKLFLPFLLFFGVLFGITIVPNFLSNHRQFTFQPMINTHEGINIDYFPLVNNNNEKRDNQINQINDNNDDIKVKQNNDNIVGNDNEKEKENDNNNNNDNNNKVVDNEEGNNNNNNNSHKQGRNFRNFSFLIFVMIIILIFILIVEKNNSQKFMRKYDGDQYLFNEDGYQNI